MPSYLQRYQTNQDFSAWWHQEARALWSELISYGPAIRDEPLYGDAQAVAHAIMQRARHNVALLIPRLHELGYRFVDPERVWVPPTPATRQMLDDLEEQYGPLPILIRAWFDVVGMVNLMGAHPKLSRCADVDWDGSDDRDGDPLVVEVLPIGIKYMDRHPPFLAFPFAPDSAFKALESGGGSLGILIPNAAFDAPIIDPGRRWTGTFLIQHLQTCFQWGGFPGLRGGWYPEQVPGALAAQAELAFLTEGLLPLY